MRNGSEINVKHKVPIYIMRMKGKNISCQLVTKDAARNVGDHILHESTLEPTKLAMGTRQYTCQNCCSFPN